MFRDVLLPDLGVGDVTLVVGRWHVQHRAVVIEGDPLVEIQAGGVLVDLPAPANGKLYRRCVLPEESVRPGQRVAIILCDEEEDE